MKKTCEIFKQAIVVAAFISIATLSSAEEPAGGNKGKTSPQKIDVRESEGAGKLSKSENNNKIFESMSKVLQGKQGDAKKPKGK